MENMGKLMLFFKETEEKYKKYGLEFFPKIEKDKLLEVNCRFEPKYFNVRWGEWPDKTVAGKIKLASSGQLLAKVPKDEIEFGAAKFITNQNNSLFSQQKIIRGLETFIKLLLAHKR